MPSTSASSCNSWTRTRPRSLVATSDGSLIDPRSPRDAQSRTMRAPASARRASVPPQASDSSSGWARTTRIVRPEKSGSDETLINRFVLGDHPLDAEPRDRAFADRAAIQREHGCQVSDHAVEAVEDHAGDAFVDDLADGAEIERDDGRSARH